jgi:hypothetical protein
MLKKFIIIMFYLYYIFKEKIDTLEALQQIQKKNNEDVRKNLEKQSMLDENLKSIVKIQGHFQVYNSFNVTLFERRKLNVFNVIYYFIYLSRTHSNLWRP